MFFFKAGNYNFKGVKQCRGAFGKTERVTSKSDWESKREYSERNNSHKSRN